MLGRTSRRTHTRGVKEKARWVRKITGRTQGASRKRLVGCARSQDAHKGRPYYGRVIGIWAHCTSKSHASCSIAWFLDVAGCSCALPHLNQAGWRRTYAKNEQINPISVHSRDAACRVLPACHRTLGDLSNFLLQFAHHRNIPKALCGKRCGKFARSSDCMRSLHLTGTCIEDACLLNTCLYFP